MKYTIILSLLLSAAVFCEAQATSPAAEALANKIAQKMKDSLALSAAQQQQVYNINLQLHQQKIAVRQQYPGNDSLITVNLQRIENKRDSLYQPVLGQAKYGQYQLKKKNLVNNQ
jgi:hypothetical protein